MGPSWILRVHVLLFFSRENRLALLLGVGDGAGGALCPYNFADVRTRARFGRKIRANEDKIRFFFFFFFACQLILPGVLCTPNREQILGVVKKKSEDEKKKKNEDEYAYVRDKFW